MDQVISSLAAMHRASRENLILRDDSHLSLRTPTDWGLTRCGLSLLAPQITCGSLGQTQQVVCHLTFQVEVLFS